MSRKVLVVDAGGRGNALADAMARSEKVDNVYVAPGNAGSALLDGCEIARLDSGETPDSIDELIGFVRENGVDLTVVGPEGYLTDGIVDRFQEEDLDIVGPTREAARLEWSKCDTNDYLSSIGVPVPEYRNFDDPEEAREYVRWFYEENPDENLVVKADGIAAGKGSLPCNGLEEALDAVEYLMEGEEFEKDYGDAGKRVTIERRLYGNEIMFFAFTDGETSLPMEAAMDYKRAFDPEDGRIDLLFYGSNPNTGGMGGYSPHPWLDEELTEKIMQRVIDPAIQNLDADYRGILYAGLMIVEEDGEKQPYVLEMNVRMGDPEGEIILPRLETDLYDVCRAILDGSLDTIELEWDPSYRVGICAVSGDIIASYSNQHKADRHGRICRGYPKDHLTNQPIYTRVDEKLHHIGREGMDKYVSEHTIIYHNGTAFNDGKLFTTGGRVFTIVSRGDTLEEARARAYEDINKIFFRGMRYRQKIGDPEVKH